MKDLRNRIERLEKAQKLPMQPVPIATVLLDGSVAIGSEVLPMAEYKKLEAPRRKWQAQYQRVTGIKPVTQITFVNG